MKSGTAKDSFLTPGEVDPRHFELLLEGTSTRDDAQGEPPAPT